MIYNFDEIIDRTNTNSVKVDGVKEHWGRTDLLPMWVADMDFRTPDFIIDAIREQCEKGILGYTFQPDEYYTAIHTWLLKRYQWNIQQEELKFIPGVVAGLAYAIQSLTNPGDKILMQPPVYHPFFLCTEKNDRIPVYNPLILENGQYKMNFPQFRELIKECKLFILCNPHNPGGRSWNVEELQEIAEICYKNNVPVISDEIHADLTLPGFVHTPFATVSEKAKDNSLTMMAASKAFNIPGLSSAYAIVENSEIRERFVNQLEKSEAGHGHIFAYKPVIAAYEQGEEWLKQLLAYIQENIDVIDEFTKKYTPKIKVIRPEASYLVFLDCRELNLSQENLNNFFVDKAHLALNDGSMFGKEGNGFMRMNVGCPRETLEKALGYLRRAYEEVFPK